jgi:hypothetical protein
MAQCGTVGIDVVFAQSQNLYGIPEHASDLRLKPTMFVPAVVNN